MAMLNTGDGRDARLGSSVVPYPSATNPDRVIAGGMVFDDWTAAMQWPGGGSIETEPTVWNRLQATYLMPESSQVRPAATVSAAAAGDGSLSPITLVPPLPSITPPNPSASQTGGQQVVSSDQVSGLNGFLCQIGSWANQNKCLAAALAFGVFYLAKGGRKVTSDGW